jgi:hypothetical protein
MRRVSNRFINLILLSPNSNKPYRINFIFIEPDLFAFNKRNYCLRRCDDYYRSRLLINVGGGRK